MTAFFKLLGVQAQHTIILASPYPVKLFPIRTLLEISESYLFVTKDAFLLCSKRGFRCIEIFQNKLGRGLFGGEGFIMQTIRRATEWLFVTMLVVATAKKVLGPRRTPLPLEHSACIIFEHVLQMGDTPPRGKGCRLRYRIYWGIKNTSLLVRDFSLCQIKRVQYGL